MNIQELRTKPVKELHKTLQQNRDKLRDLRFRVAQKQVKNIREIREVKRTIARVLMLIKKQSQKVNKDS